jgi:hypothetical protein
VRSGGLGCGEEGLRLHDKAHSGGVVVELGARRKAREASVLFTC